MNGIGQALEGKRRSLADLVADAVADAIASGELKPGERIVETTISDQMQVSRFPLREGLKILQTQGIITGVEHKSPRVAAFDTVHIKRVLEVRLALEELLLRDALVAWRAGHATLDGLQEGLHQMRIAETLGDITAAMRADVAYHRQISVASGNNVTATLWNAIARHVLIIFSLERSDVVNIADLVSQHEEFQAFIESQVVKPGSETALRNYLRGHIFLFTPH
ncbi:GntR family transcriptional regulator [Agrobacterium sp. LAD9]|uniref:GntR family transcriptional regulator n=1 Tax=Agrobacterium sp. LAD9 TaxID=2055153 RepID=UPI000D1E11C3|nr:FCD domain-containing protein [Agrobacterium sp. LAD9]